MRSKSLGSLWRNLWRASWKMKTGELLSSLSSKGQGGSCLLPSSFTQVICSRTKLSWWGAEQAVTYCLPKFALQSQGQKSALAGVNSLFHPSWCCPEPTLHSPHVGRGIRRWHLQNVLPSSPCWVQQVSRGLPALCVYSLAENNLWHRLNLEGKREK